MRRLRSARRALEPVLAAIPPASGAVVMGTGIVSIALSLDDHETLSRILLGIDGVVWIALGTLLASLAARQRARLRVDAHSPAGIALLVIAFVLWLALLAQC